MPGDVSVTVTGTAELASTLRRAARDLGDMTQANMAAAKVFVAVAQARAPRLTGALAAATQPAAEKDAAGFVNALPYFGPIHYGWPARNIEAQPYVDEAVEETEDQWLEVYNRAVAEIIGQLRGA